MAKSYLFQNGGFLQYIVYIDMASERGKLFRLQSQIWLVLNKHHVIILVLVCDRSMREDVLCLRFVGMKAMQGPNILHGAYSHRLGS